MSRLIPKDGEVWIDGRELKEGKALLKQLAVCGSPTSLTFA